MFEILEAIGVLLRAIAWPSALLSIAITIVAHLLFPDMPNYFKIAIFVVSFVFLTWLFEKHPFWK